MSASLVPTVKVVSGRPVVSSVQIAEHFDKRHDNVLRVIKTTEIPEGFRLLNFEETVIERPNPSGGKPIECPAYNLTRDGFTFIAMSFTGKKANAWKVKYIEAFNALERELTAAAQITAGGGEVPTSPWLPPATATQRKPLIRLVEMWSARSGLTLDECWTMLLAQFCIQNLRDLPGAWLPDAVAFVQTRLDTVLRPVATPSARPLPTAENDPARLARIGQVLTRETRTYRERIAPLYEEICSIHGPGVTQAVGRRSPANEARGTTYMVALMAVEAMLNLSLQAEESLRIPGLVEEALATGGK